MDLSIIVPVYNVEQYLKQCLDILTNQEKNKYDYEIVCVNDGSTDNSLELLKYYEKEYRAILKVINIANGGVSNARNIGIKNSTGEYITFVDADDWTDLNFVNFLMKESEKDVFAIFDSCYVFKNIFCEHKEFIKDTVFNAENSVCGKTFKRKLLVKYNITFPIDITMGEDLAFTFSYICCIENYKHVEKTIYYYRQNRNGSLMNSKIIGTYKQVFKACEYVCDFARNNNLLERNLSNIEYLFIKNLLVRNTIKVIKLENGINNKFKQLKKQIAFVNKYFPEWNENSLFLSDADRYLSKKLGGDYIKVLINLKYNLAKSTFYFLKGKLNFLLKGDL